MGFWAFVGIIIAVALGVYFGLKMYNDPEGFKADLCSLGALVELLLIFIIPIVIIAGIGLIIRYLVKNGVPQWIDGALEVVGYVFMIVFGLGLLCFMIRSIVHKVKEEGGLKKRWKIHKPKKEVVKNNVKNTTKGCLKYTGIIILGTIVFLGALILLGYLLFG